jgi:hypothetical protein
MGKFTQFNLWRYCNFNFWYAEIDFLSKEFLFCI